MGECCLGVWLIFRQPFEDDGICAFGIKFDFTIRAPNNGGHAFPSGVEFADVQYLKFLTLPVNVNEDRFWFAGLKSKGKPSQLITKR